MATNRIPGASSEASKWGDNGRNPRDPFPPKPQKGFKWRYVLYGLLAVLLLDYGSDWLAKQKETDFQTIKEILRPVEDEEESGLEVAAPTTEGQDRTATRALDEADAIDDWDEEELEPEDIDVIDFIRDQSAPKAAQQHEGRAADESASERSASQKSASEKSAPQKREKSISELLEERTHKSVVEQARRAGVSTEGSTSDILERITHKNVVDQARRAGVSTEGSTSDILERITHKNVVDQARRAGVSTEGSTSDILERITRKSLEKY